MKDGLERKHPHMACDRASDGQRYHDGELMLDQRGHLEAHFHECAECRQALRDLGRLSLLLGSVPGMEPRPQLAVRLHAGSRNAIRDVKTMRLASWLTAAAASILIGMLFLHRETGTDLVPSPETWEAIAIRPTVEEISSDSLVLAQWMVDELSSVEQR